jgi:hypothetical protein
MDNLMMDRHQREALDRHITGNYGEDQFKGLGDDEEDVSDQCQVSHCEAESVDGVLCERHLGNMEGSDVQ